MRFLLPLDPEFKARKRLGEDPRLRKRDKDTLDAIDELDQKADRGWKVGWLNTHWLLILTLLFFATNFNNIVAFVRDRFINEPPSENVHPPAKAKS